jgi:hypothetical protein
MIDKANREQLEEANNDQFMRFKLMDVPQIPILTMRPNYVPSDWTCHLFGGTSTFATITWRPAKGQVPNRFVRWMMRICFACTWIKDQPKEK